MDDKPDFEITAHAVEDAITAAPSEHYLDNLMETSSLLDEFINDPRAAKLNVRAMEALASYKGPGRDGDETAVAFLCSLMMTIDSASESDAEAIYAEAIPYFYRHLPEREKRNALEALADIAEDPELADRSFIPALRSFVAAEKEKQDSPAPPKPPRFGL